MKPVWFKAAMATNPGVLVRLCGIGAVMLSVAAAFAYSGGWFSPARLTQDRMMAAFHIANGTHAGFRRNHAKGVCVTGWFESSGQAAELSKAAVFKPGRVPVVGRFALAGGMPVGYALNGPQHGAALAPTRRRGMAHGHEQHPRFPGQLSARIL
jgi:catalase